MIPALLSIVLLFDTLGEIALQNAARLAATIGPRPVGTQENKRAADEIFQILTGCGLSPQRHQFSFVDAPGVEVLGAHFLSPLEAHFDGQNIWARIGDPNAPALLVGAHYDSVSIRGPGARDNAAGVGAVLSAACALKDQWKGERSLVFVAFDGEETHLLGSRAFLRDKPAGEISMVLSLDILGSDNLSLNGLSPLVGSPLISAALSAASEEEVSLSIPFAQLVISRFIPQGERSDHGPFTAANIPAFQLYSRGALGFDPYYHATKDNVERLDKNALDDAVRWIVAFLPRADKALPSNTQDRFFPIWDTLLLPGWLLQLFFAVSLLLAVVSVALNLKQKRERAPLPEVFASLGLWVLLSLVISLGFFVPFWAGRLVHGVSLPWLSAIFWYTLSGVFVLSAVALSLARRERISLIFSGVRRFFLFSLFSLSLALLLFWWAGTLEAAAPFALSLSLVSLGGLFPGRARLLALSSLLIAAALLSPWRYLEGVLAWTLGGSSWMYVFVVWGAVLVFGAAALGARPLSTSHNQRPPVWVVLLFWALSLVFCLVAFLQGAYSDEIPRRPVARLLYQEDKAAAEVTVLHGEIADGLTLRVGKEEHPLFGERTKISIPIKSVGAFTNQKSKNAQGAEIHTLTVTPLAEPFVDVVFTYRALDHQNQPIPFQYRTEKGDWRWISSPLGLRVGFYGPQGEVTDQRALNAPRGTTLKVKVTAALRSLPDDISFVEEPHQLVEVQPFFVEERILREF